MEWSDFNTAASMREVLYDFIKRTLDRLIPYPQFVVVESVNESGGTASVYFPGETEPVPVPLRSVIPTAAGQVAVVGGRAGDRHIEAVVGSGSHVSGLDRVGTVFLWAATQPPYGSIQISGQSLSTSQYPALFAVLRYNHGGSGGTFNAPVAPSTPPTGYIWCIRAR